VNQQDNDTAALGPVIGARWDTAGTIIGVIYADAALTGPNCESRIVEMHRPQWRDVATFSGPHLAPPGAYQTPLDKRCKRCMQNHPGKPCRSEIQRTRGAKKVRPVYR
jgi:hypothetical protein